MQQRCNRRRGDKLVEVDDEDPSLTLSEVALFALKLLRKLDNHWVE